MHGARPPRTIVLAAATLLLGALVVPTPVRLPGGSGGIGFDDLQFASGLGKLLVPAGRTGRLYLVDPRSLEIEAIGGFSRGDEYRGGHEAGITSADSGDGFIFVTDRSASALDVVDPGTRQIVARTALSATPDYVRFVPAAREVWVSEPTAQRIEVFRLGSKRHPKPVHSGFIAVAGGPESLLIDARRSRAYTNLWAGATIVIALVTRRTVARWPNGCRGSRGLALDALRGFLLVACAEGKLSVLDARTGARLGAVSSGSGVDIIAYRGATRHVYLPGARSATMGVIEISSAGKPRLLATVATAVGAHCVAADNLGKVYVCDPRRGRLLVFTDPAPTKR